MKVAVLNGGDRLSIPIDAEHQIVLRNTQHTAESVHLLLWNSEQFQGAVLRENRELAGLQLLVLLNAETTSRLFRWVEGMSSDHHTHPFLLRKRSPLGLDFKRVDWVGG